MLFCPQNKSRWVQRDFWTILVSIHLCCSLLVLELNKDRMDLMFWIKSFWFHEIPPNVNKKSWLAFSSYKPHRMNMCRLSMQCQVWTTVKSKSNWTIFNLRLISPSIESHQKTCLVSWHLFERTLYIIDHYLPLHVIFIYTGCWFRPPKVLSVKKENYLCVCICTRWSPQWTMPYYTLRIS